MRRDNCTLQKCIIPTSTRLCRPRAGQSLLYQIIKALLLKWRALQQSFSLRLLVAGCQRPWRTPSGIQGNHDCSFVLTSSNPFQNAILLRIGEGCSKRGLCSCSCSRPCENFLEVEDVAELHVDVAGRKFECQMNNNQNSLYFSDQCECFCLTE